MTDPRIPSGHAEVYEEYASYVFDTCECGCLRRDDDDHELVWKNQYGLRAILTCRQCDRFEDVIVRFGPPYRMWVKIGRQYTQERVSQ